MYITVQMSELDTKPGLRKISILLSNEELIELKSLAKVTHRTLPEYIVSAIEETGNRILRNPVLKELFDEQDKDTPESGE